LEDRGFLDGATITLLKQQRHVDVIVPLKSTMLSYQEAVQLAELQGVWQPHPSRDNQHIAFVKGVDHVWDGCNVALHACVIRYWHRKKKAWDPIPTATLLEHGLLTQGFMGTSKAVFPRRLRPQSRASTWTNLVSTRK